MLARITGFRDFHRGSLEGLGCSCSAVTTKRNKLGILPSLYVWSEEAISLLGSMSDSAAAVRPGLGNGIVQRKRADLGIRAFQAKVGGTADAFR